MNMKLCVTFMVVGVAMSVLANESEIIEYFNSDTFKTIQRYWQTERKSFENALTLIMQQDYTYERILSVNNLVSDGFYFTDNVVHLILLRTNLQMLPIMTAPQVTFALASNYLRIEARLGRMIMKTNYLLLRNQSDLVYTASEQNPKKKSPFSFKQVQDNGNLTIIAQDCIVVGYAITRFFEDTVNLYLDTFKVTNCKFSVEIYSSGAGSPPLFGPYFSKQQSAIIQRKLEKPIRLELMSKLQDAVSVYVNTSLIFGDNFPQLRHNQSNIFNETSDYLCGLVKKYVKYTEMRNQATLQLKPLEVLFTRTCPEGTCERSVGLKHVVLNGLDTAYSTQKGGPFKFKSTKLAEAIEFRSLQVKGKVCFKYSNENQEHDFTVDLKGVTVNIEMGEKAGSFIFLPQKMHFNGWSWFEISFSETYNAGNVRNIWESLITGYLMNEIPKRLLYHIYKIFRTVSSKNKANSNKALNEPTSVGSDLNNERNDRDAAYESYEYSESRAESNNERHASSLDSDNNFAVPESGLPHSGESYPEYKTLKGEANSHQNLMEFSVDTASGEGQPSSENGIEA